MVKVLVAKWRHAQYVGQFSYLNDKYPDVSMRVVNYPKEVSYVVKASYEEKHQPSTGICVWWADLDLRINIDEIDFHYEDEKKEIERVKQIVKKFLNELVDENGNVTFDVSELYDRLIKLSTTLKAPYSTAGHEASIYDTGGDYPDAHLKFKYYA